jgi:hypothetical protein
MDELPAGMLLNAALVKVWISWVFLSIFFTSIFKQVDRLEYSNARSHNVAY